MTLTVFDLPADRPAKADPAMIGGDAAHFAAVADALARQIDGLTARRNAARRAPAGTGQQALDRDLEIHQLTARLRSLRRFGLDLCLGRIVSAAGDALYIGRFGLADDQGRQLLVDWRTPAAEPYFAATYSNPMGLSSRRRYRWSGGRIRDYWDEVFTAEGLETDAALDDESAFIASLGASRSPRMRDVLSTIQADQDRIIRAPAAGALVVDGGPGTGKTVVALHRAAYLLYADPRLGEGRGGVLFVGPHAQYLAYVADVLPSLGEERVRTCTVRDLVEEGTDAVPEADPAVARLKADARMVDAIEPAVALYEEPPTRTLIVESAWGDLVLTPSDLREAFASAEPGLSHNEARDQVWERVLELLVDQVDPDVAPPHRVHRALARNEGLSTMFAKAWPLVEASVLVADLWTVPAYLRRCAPWLTAHEVSLLQRPEGSAWTVADLPLLDAARRRLGDPAASARRRRRERRLAAEREYMGEVVEQLSRSVDLLKWMDGDDLRNSLVDEAVAPELAPDDLEGPFAHVIVDEAQELTDAEWRMLRARCPSHSFTIVGDRAQARHGFAESWEERLARVGLPRVAEATLRINYRTPAEVMRAAAPVIRAAIPDANVPESIRTTGIPVRYEARAERDAVLDGWLAAHPEGIACVIGADSEASDPHAADLAPRVRSLTPVTAKGLEFDLVVLLDPQDFGAGIEGAVDRYVSMTRATQELVILTSTRPIG